MEAEKIHHLISRVEDTFESSWLFFSKEGLESIFKSSAHLNKLSIWVPQIELVGDYDFSIDTNYSIHILELGYSRKTNN